MTTYSTTINPIFVPHLTCHDRLLIEVGSAGSGKSHFLVQKFILRIIRAIKGGYQEFFLGLRKTQPAVRKSVFDVVGNYIKVFGLWPRTKVNRTALSYTFPGGSQFFCMGMDDPEKMKSIENLTSVWMEETTEFSYPDYMQIDLRLRGETPSYKQISMSFNPILSNQWIPEQFFDGDNPKTDLKDTTIMRSTWRDNLMLKDDIYTSRLTGLKDKDESLWKIYSEGLWGVLKHMIYSNYDTIAPKDWPEAFDDVWYGMDFNYSLPAAMTEIGSLDGKLFERELIYESGLETPDLIQRLRSLEVHPSSPIYADPSRPDIIATVHRAGFNIKPANNAVKPGIDFVKTHHPKICGDSANLLKEKKSYKLKEDKDGNVLPAEVPVKAFDHLMDAERYALYTHLNPEGKSAVWFM